MKTRFFFISCFVILFWGISAQWFDIPPALAQAIQTNEAFGGVAPESFAETAGLAGGDITLIIARLIRVVLGTLGVVAVAFVLYGGFLWMTSRGEDLKIKKAKMIMTNALIGLIIVLSSFAIAQFVISRLSSATGAGTTTEGTGKTTYNDVLDASATFVLRSVNTECASAIRNLELQFIFSQNVSVSTVNDSGIVVSRADGDPVSGSFETSGSRVTFIPSATCTTSDGIEVHCFDAETVYEVNLSSAVLKSSSGRTLECSETYPCHQTFTTGSGFDTKKPDIQMTSPDDGGSAYSGTAELLQALTSDDSGVSSLEFSLDGDAVDVAGLDESSALALAMENIFYGEWDTVGYVTNKMYHFSAEGFDCGGNSDTSSEIDVVLRAPNCNNDIQDAEDPYFEDGVDCGGNQSDEYYCGACNGSSCIENSDCASGSCAENICVYSAEIEAIFPGDGAPGNLMTISGNGFGNTQGTILFLGSIDDDTDDVSVGPYTACDGTWTDNQIVIQLDEKMVSGPVELVTSDGFRDRTDDENGPLISDFEVNTTVRPGLCRVDPEKASGKDTVTVQGNNFGDNQGSSVLYFDTSTASSYPSWASNSLKAVVPLLDTGSYDLQLFGGNGDTREGSNKLIFNINSTSSSSEPPVISDVDTGVKRCEDEKGFICTDDADCVAGIPCAEDKNAGPISQYVTIYGSHFGTTPGTVRFRNQDLDLVALADTNFPDSCGEDFWDNDSILVKVPKIYDLSDGHALNVGLHDLWVVRGEDGTVSDPVDFEVIEGKAGPSICAVEPDAGPPGTDVSFFGEEFGSDKGSVIFYENQKVSPGAWSDEQISGTIQNPLQVPTQAKTGPVKIQADDGQYSNSVSFEVGMCDVDFSCGSGQECCADGACRIEETCKESIPVSHYAYFFSTGDIPEAPEVIIECSDTYISPTPWEFWEGGTDVCLTAAVAASFSEPMDTKTFTSSTISVEKCLLANCDSTTAVEMSPKGNPTSMAETSFFWEPAQDFEPETRYRITVKGGENGVKSVQGVAMEKDSQWEFVTAPSGNECTIGGVYLTPAKFTATEKEQRVQYTVAPISDEYQCLLLSCTNHQWTYNSSDPSKADFAEFENACSLKVAVHKETNPGVPVVITSWLYDNGNLGPSDTADLTINFTDPKIIDFWPGCDSVCLNASVSAVFNIDMKDEFSGFEIGGDHMVRLYECEDPGCTSDELTEVNDRSVTYDLETFTVTIRSNTDLKTDTSYRVVFSGELTSTSDVSLSKSASDLAYGDDFSWIFTTKDEACAVNRVEVTPEQVTLTIIGERQTFQATPYSAPDDCSENGQALNGDHYQWSAWTAEDVENNVEDADVVQLMVDGKIRVSETFPAYCSSSSCNTIGSNTPVAICGNNTVHCTTDANCVAYGADATCNDFGQCVEPGEDCDDGNVTENDGCSSICLTEGVTACVSLTDVGCCGNGVREGREECDDKNTKNGDGCSSVCLNEGAKALKYDCGDGKVAQSASTGGEECDWKEENDVYGCSSNCLNVGSISKEDLYAICGNGAQENGEDCDDKNTKNGDGCSSTCQNEGSSSSYSSVCGNNKITCHKNVDCSSYGSGTQCNVLGQCVQTGEDCDDGNIEDGDGCSFNCLFEGSSVEYTNPSICTDGTIGTGEACDAEEVGTVIAGFGVAEITTDAPEEVTISGTGTASSTVTATEGTSGVTGFATVTLECSCTSDVSCGDAEVYGCGDANCCFERPHILLPTTPANGKTDVCRNTAVAVDFDQIMDETSFKQTIGEGENQTVELNMYLELTAVNGTKITDANATTLCPASYHKEVAFADELSNPLVRIWDWLVRGVAKLFNHVYAAEISCQLAVSYSIEKTDTGSKVYVNYGEALQANGTYRLIVMGDSDDLDGKSDGVKSTYGVALLEDISTTFTVGNEICALEAVQVTDEGKEIVTEFDDASSGFFSEQGEQHTLTTTAFTLHGANQEEIQEIAGVYDWNWSWDSTSSDTEADNAVSVTKADTTQTTAVGVANGKENGIAIATITTDVVGKSVGSEVSGTVSLTAFLCENPWPNPEETIFPFADTAEAGFDFNLSSPYTNFSFSYCRDMEGKNTTLPELRVVETPQSPISEIYKEILFLVEGTNDAVGVRVFSNEKYLSPNEWYKDQAFTGSPTSTLFDGYEAIQDGDTYYVVAANQDGDTIYPNIYVISVNEDAGDETKQIMSQILKNWLFNANSDVVTDLNVCRTGSEYLTDSVTGGFVSCDWDQDCRQVTYSDSSSAVVPDGWCDAQKAKLSRDMRRLTDIKTIEQTLDSYGDIHRHCSATYSQACGTDDDCSGDEICLANVPLIQSGSFLRAFTTSTWPSWSAVLANELGTSLPQDPINIFVSCPDGTQETYCWDGTQGIFQCQEGSHAYLFQSVAGESYNLYAQLEMDEADWVYNIDDDATDNANIFVEYAQSSNPDGFYRDSEMCSGVLIGSSARCGDGVLATTEMCEIGQSKTKECDANGDGDMDGTISLACINDGGICRYQTSSDSNLSECILYECGNGVMDPGETCDDAILNGTYGFCDENCSLAGAFYCGDGSIAGGEECDCGSNTDTMDTGSWSSIHCSKSNGQYTTNPDGGCAFDCTFPGPSCGDGEINGDEACDGDYKSWSGKLCGSADAYVSCETDAECMDTECGDGGSSCPMSSICVGGSNAGAACTDSLDCNSGDCSDITYQLVRYRSCDDSDATPTCTWNQTTNPGDWTDCVGGNQYCGNGVQEGKEECDDGNTDNSDACTTLCKINVCGDGHSYNGVETCDEGDQNGVVCTADYQDTCAYCTVSCQYTVVSGAYCGDQVIEEETEYCDGTSVSKFCFKPHDTPDERDVTGMCETDADCNVNAGYTCETTGVCDGGSHLFGSGDTATYADYNGLPCVSGSIEFDERCGTTNSGTGTSEGVCVAPECASSCFSSCPYTYEQSSILIQTELSNATQQTSADLYSYLSGQSPDTALLFLPACTVGTQLMADIDMSDVEPPTVDIVFVTDLSGSMTTVLDTKTGDNRIQVTVDSMTQAIQDLFDDYGGNSANMRISTVSFTDYLSDGVDTDGENGITDSDGCIQDTKDGDALAWIDHGLGSSTGENDMLYNAETGVETYVARAHGYTPTAAGLKCADKVLQNSDANYKVIVLLSDGEPTINLAGVINTSTPESNVPEVVSVRDQMISKGIHIFTAALTTNTDLVGYMAHFSSDVCGTCDACESSCETSCASECSGESATDQSCVDDCEANGDLCLEDCATDVDCDVDCDGMVGSALSACLGACTSAVNCVDTCEKTIKSCKDLCTPTDEECEDSCVDTCTSSSCEGSCLSYEDVNDCKPRESVEYAYSASTAEDLETMYQTIVDSILGVTVGFTTDFAGQTTLTSGVVADGDNVIMPFPEGFDCRTTGAWTIPFRISFAGTGVVHISDISLNYCPID